ncbi:MAG TPA: hypothetical protein VF488_14025 [Gemmatimonadaceae bacterium]
MPYTLWSRGRLLGETDLGFIYREDGLRCGWFHPTDLGDRLMPAATGVAPALRTEWAIGPDATTRADVLSAVDHEDALELELRGPDGAVIATKSISIIDTYYLLSIPESDPGREGAPDQLDAEEQAEIETALAEWDPDGEPVDLQLPSGEDAEFPRYQIQVRLVDHDRMR